MNDKLPNEVTAFLLNLALALLPGALGALVAQIWERDLTWPERIVSLVAGIIISYYAKLLILGLSPWSIDPMLGDSIGFMCGLVAFKSAPGFQRSAAAVIADIPGRLAERLSKKGDSA